MFWHRLRSIQITMLSPILIPLLFIALLVVPRPGYSMLCKAGLSGSAGRLTPESAQIKALRDILKEDRALNGDSEPFNSEELTMLVKNVSADGYITFSKQAQSKWRSSAWVHNGAPTPQGDLRSFIALAGPEIAYYLGFRVSTSRDGLTDELRVPQAQTLNKKIKLLNKALIDLKLDPISFQLASTGLVTDKELIYNSVRKSQDNLNALLTFPFADHDAQLLPHEVGFHLGMLMSSTKLVKRARSVNIRVVQFLEILKQFPEFKKLSEMLTSMRSLELDIGSSVPGVGAADIRINLGMPSYDQILQKRPQANYQKDFLTIEQALSFLSKPALMPAEAVLHYVSVLTGIGADLVVNKKGLEQTPVVEVSHDNSVAVSLSASQKIKLHTLLKEFLNKTASDKNEFLPEPEMATVADLFNNLHKRIQEIHQALQTIPKSDQPE